MGDFCIWEGICGTGMDAFVAQDCNLYSAFSSEQRSAFDVRYSECNKANRTPRVTSVVGVSVSSGSLLLIVQQKRSETSSRGSAKGKSVQEKTTTAPKKKSAGSSQPKEKKPVKNVDPAVVLKVEKT